MLSSTSFKRSPAGPPRPVARSAVRGLARDFMRDWQRWSPVERIVAGCLLVPALVPMIVAGMRA